MTQRALFLHSLVALAEDEYHTLDHFFHWFRHQRDSVNVNIEKIPFHQLKEWHFDKDTGNICHNSGKFFTIQGIEVETNFGNKTSWQQPIINQPEIGFLGIIAKKLNGVLHFLMQAKIEPGNIDFVQLSPTLQATKSNYTQVHGGNKPKYLEFFSGGWLPGTRVLIDQLQSEQGARFLKKRNRNIIIEVLGEIPVYENFIWLTLGQLKRLSTFDNLVNMDSRTVISSISYGKVKDYGLIEVDRFKDMLDEAMLFSAIDGSKSVYEMDQLISWITNLKTAYDLKISDKPLKHLKDWNRDEFSIYNVHRKYFSIHAMSVSIENREVVNWSQPILQAAQEGIIGFLVKKVNGVYHFLVQAKVEAGNFDILELAPTVQCLTGNYRRGLNEYEVPFLQYFLDAEPSGILYRAMQSEEGGRFYREQNLNIIVQAEKGFSETDIPLNYTWMTLDQLMEFGRYNNYLNIQARSLLSVIDFKKPGQ